MLLLIGIQGLKRGFERALELAYIRTPKLRSNQNVVVSRITERPSLVDDYEGFQHTNLVQNRFDFANLQGKLFESSPITDCVFYETMLKDSMFLNLEINHSYFEKSKINNSWFENVKIENSVLRDCDFTGTGFKNVTIKNCDLTGSYVYARDSRTSRKVLIEGDALLSYLTDECGIELVRTLF